MNKKRLTVSAIMQCVIYGLFLLYGMFTYDLFYWVGEMLSLSYSDFYIALYVLIGVLCISVPTVIASVKFKPSILSDVVTLPIIFPLAYFIHPDGVYGFTPTHFFGEVAGWKVAVGITVQIVVVELVTSIICMIIYKSKHKQ